MGEHHLVVLLATTNQVDEPTGDWSSGRAQIGGKHPMSNEEFIDQLDESEFDVDMMRDDERHGNFSQDRAEEYRHEAIVAASLSNGQFAQARRQCATYGLSYAEERAKHDAEEERSRNATLYRYGGLGADDYQQGTRNLEDDNVTMPEE
jgi:hypothetical protein